MSPSKSYKITPSVRKLLANPIGTLFEGSIDENIPKLKQWFDEKDIPYPSIICVGDVVSNAFLNDPELSQHLRICIVDEKTKRGEFQISANLVEYYFTRIHNPPGLIRSTAIHEIKTRLKSSDKTLIVVDGEEDLLVIPAILHSEENTYVVYGQPPVTDLKEAIPAGLVMISVNSDTKARVQKLLDQFEKV